APASGSLTTSCRSVQSSPSAQPCWPSQQYGRHRPAWLSPTQANPGAQSRPERHGASKSPPPDGRHAASTSAPTGRTWQAYTTGTAGPLASASASIPASRPPSAPSGPASLSAPASLLCPSGPASAPPSSSAPPSEGSASVSSAASASAPASRSPPMSSVSGSSGDESGKSPRWLDVGGETPEQARASSGEQPLRQSG